jgi:CRP-like cAMP-binding protein
LCINTWSDFDYHPTNDDSEAVINLLQEGQHAERFFVLLEGEIVVWKKQGDQEIIVARNRPGAFFGEIPAFTRHALRAVRSRRGRLPANRLSGGGVLEVLRLCPAISGEIFRSVATRLRNIEGSAQ